MVWCGGVCVVCDVCVCERGNVYFYEEGYIYIYNFILITRRSMNKQQNTNDERERERERVRVILNA